uniref:SHSP18.9 n=1 Tax=Agasicles hygrophila TaxID=715812 RepID=A0A7G8KP65_9CUCU|nr:sHSP18.9 [Agasicles hygrophila]
MSLLPLLFDDRYWGVPNQRRIVPHQNYWSDILEPLSLVNSLIQSPEYTELQSRGSTSIDKDKFQANFDVQHFKPNEIVVKVGEDNSVTIEAKHEEKQDEHGHIFRHFVRRYVLPKNCDVSRLESKLSSDGVLSITAPTIDDKNGEERTIPISHTGMPAMKEQKPK